MRAFYSIYIRTDCIFCAINKNWAVSQSEAARLGLQIIGTVGIIQMKKFFINNFRWPILFLEPNGLKRT